MIFKNPSILYGLLFLIVPIIVHLFQLRRFTKVPFTNVAFLKPLITQTRKSRQLKKWLTLLARMAVIACIVIAFAQPFIPGSNVATQEKETAIYLDNSYSMQSSGSKGELFKTAVTDLLERLPNDQKFTLFTNSNTYTNTTKKEIANDLLNSEYQSKPLSYEQIQLKANALLNDNKKRKELIIISDFQKIDETFPDTIKGLKRELVFLEAEGSNNISIDTAYISRRETNSIDISVSVTSDKAINNPVTLSLENNDVLVAKTSVDLTNLKDTGVFNFETSQPLQGRIYLEDNSLSFDNELFISNNIDRKIKVLAINTVDGDFLKRIYTEDEFDFTAVRSRDLNFNLLKEQNLIILNELNSISVNLAKEINTYLRNGGYLVMIPALDQSGYSSINNIQGTDNISEKEKRITEINYNHPLLKGVFNKQISNFQYPKVNATTNTISALNPILKFEDGSSFLFQKGNVFNFTAPLNNQNSNFKNSPLIVPILYNMGRNSLPVQQLYYHIGDKNSIAIPEKIIRDEILELRNESNALIPKQRAFESFVLIEIEDELNNSGNYKVIKDNESITTLSFNSSRQENKLNYFTASELGSNNIAYSVEDLVYKLNEEDGVLSLWRYFVIGALFFLICELLILKFLK
ncbi:BatA domain-containing protein [Nonlabens ulvanivorans]|uniref:BatA domain-containing protein n=1 Tax=Nonlabens ulvanivorans TaxID=906888 RepID=UPI0029430D82|nr:BatA domain-containing protein [Nonlabens ulvanivorans]WOI23566.1 BatA domain-containing protein [Nonlabens ulvanivorans]